jgi:hypothetical protein
MQVVYQVLRTPEYFEYSVLSTRSTIWLISYSEYSLFWTRCFDELTQQWN